MIKSLATSADINVTDQAGATPLIYAAAFGNTEQRISFASESRMRPMKQAAAVGLLNQTPCLSAL
jgi:hypothetical protein